MPKHACPDCGARLVVIQSLIQCLGCAFVVPALMSEEVDRMVYAPLWSEPVYPVSEREIEYEPPYKYKFDI